MQGSTMSNDSPTVLIVDDEPLNLMILEERLGDAGYETVKAENGLVAWELLENSHERFDAVLLDRMMPEMDGIEVLKRIKSHSGMKKLPVIMQTAKAAKHEVQEGLEAGAYYYLTKPFEKEHLLAIVESAMRDYRDYRELESRIALKDNSLACLDHGQFSFRRLQEGRELAAVLASASDSPETVVVGLLELLVNALEHGNLGIGYNEKGELHEEGHWEEEIEHRISLPENKRKRVVVQYERSDSEITYLVEDQGPGFDWEQYLEMSVDRAFDNHGRGIAMARMLSFDHLQYLDSGNRVKATVYLNRVTV